HCRMKPIRIALPRFTDQLVEVNETSGLVGYTITKLGSVFTKNAKQDQHLSLIYFLGIAWNGHGFVGCSVDESCTNGSATSVKLGESWCQWAAQKPPQVARLHAEFDDVCAIEDFRREHIRRFINVYCPNDEQIIRQPQFSW